MLNRPGEGVVVRTAVADVLYFCCRCRCDRYLVAVLQRCHCCGCAFRYGYCVALFTVRYGVFILRMLCTVILPLAISGLNLQLGLVLRDLQCAFRFADVVVFCQRALIQRVGELVCTLAYFCLCAGDVVCRAFAVHKAVSADCYVGLGVLHQRRAVILLLAVCTRQRYRTLLDAQCAGFLLRNVIACGDIFSFGTCAGHYCYCSTVKATTIWRTCNILSAGCGVTTDRQYVTFSKTCDCVLLGFNCAAGTGYCYFFSNVAVLRLTIIGFGRILNDNAELSSVYYQTTKIFRDGVV